MQIILKTDKNRIHIFQKVEQFEYLGFTTNKEEERKEIDKTVLKGTKAYEASRNMLKSNKTLRNKAKEHIYKTVVRSNVL